MRITLSSLADELESSLDQMDPETGELGTEYGHIREMVETKAASVAAYALNSEAQADAMEARAKELAAGAKAIRKRGEWLRRYLLENMQRTGITEIKANDGSLRIKRYPERDVSVEVFQPELVPADYMRVIPATEAPDKTLIGRALKDGFDVAGCRIVKRDRLEVK